MLQKEGAMSIEHFLSFFHHTMPPQVDGAEFHSTVYAITRQIPLGKVTSYGKRQQ